MLDRGHNADFVVSKTLGKTWWDGWAIEGDIECSVSSAASIASLQRKASGPEHNVLTSSFQHPTSLPRLFVCFFYEYHLSKALWAIKEIRF